MADFLAPFDTIHERFTSERAGVMRYALCVMCYALIFKGAAGWGAGNWELGTGDWTLGSSFSRVRDGPVGVRFLQVWARLCEEKGGEDRR